MRCAGSDAKTTSHHGPLDNVDVQGKVMTVCFGGTYGAAEPGEHAVQSSPNRPSKPASQMHSVDPGTDREFFPHAAQDLLPDTAEKVFEGHVLHCLASTVCHSPSKVDCNVEDSSKGKNWTTPSPTSCCHISKYP